MSTGHVKHESEMLRSAFCLLRDTLDVEDMLADSVFWKRDHLFLGSK